MSLPDRYLKPTHTVKPSTTTHAAALIMKNENVGALVVVDEDQRPVGVITDRDLALTILREGLDPRETPVERCMTAPAVILPVDEDLVQASRLMRKHAIRRLPVIDELGVLVGLLSADDLIREFATDLRWAAEATQTGIENEARPPERSASVFGKE